jgi:hypothetical protein
MHLVVAVIAVTNYARYARALLFTCAFSYRCCDELLLVAVTKVNYSGVPV